MANTRGVFTLQDVRYAQEDDVWVSPEQAFASNITSPPNVGYWAGGIPSPNKSSTEKINFSTDSTAALPGANLTQARYNSGAISTVNHGYQMGGAPSLSTSDKFSYATETYSGITPLPYARQYACGTGNDTAGYLGGGDGATTVSIVDKMIFAVDSSFSLPSASLSAARTYLTSSSSPSAGYYGGGFPGPLSRMDKLTFSTETTAYIPAANLSQGIYGMTATGDSDAGYYGCGYTGSFQSGVDKLSYSTDTTAALPTSSDLTLEKIQRGRLSSSSAGYWNGGTPGNITTTDKFSFSTETAAATPGANSSVPLYGHIGMSPRNVTGYSLPLSGYVASTQNLKGAPSPGFGYWAGGGPSSQVVKHTFSSDSAGRAPSADLNVASYAQAAMSSANNFYVAAGGNPAKSSTEKVSYASDTATLIPGATVSLERRVLMGVGNKDKGYAVGGAIAGTDYSVVDRITYSTETSVRIPAANLLATPGVSVAAGAGTPGFGFIAGGFSASVPGRISSFDRIDYTTETTSRSPSTNLPQANNNLTGTGTGYAGYRGGGETPSSISNISRHVYSTDAVSYLTNSLPSGAQTNFESNGSGVSAYWGGNVSDLDKMSYSTETGYTIPATGVDKGYASAASTEEFDMPQPRPETPTLEVSYTQITTPFTGYFGGGGGPGGKTSNYYKLLFASETGSFLPSTHMATARSTDLGGYSDSTDGWTMGGYAGPPTFAAVSNTDRVTYASDTSVAVPGANLPGGGRYGGRQGCSTTAGYYVAGYGGGALSSTLKMPFSTESQTITPGAALSSARYYFCGGGGTDKGYFGGGYENSPGTPVTKFDKLVYSTDTMTASPASNLKIENTRSNSKACGDSRSLYFGGASSPATGLLDFGYKIPYNTDTSMLVSGFVIKPRTSAVSTGHELEGYYMGGEVPSPYVQLTTVDKINYATEVCSLVPTASLPEHRGGGSNLGCRNMAASGGGTSNTL